MKKLTLIIVTIALLCTLSLALFACNNTNTDNTTESGDVSGEISGDVSGEVIPDPQTMTLVLLEGDYVEEFTVDLDKLAASAQKSTGLIAVLDYLKQTENLTYSTDSTGFLTQVNEIKQEDNKYIYLYTSVAKDENLNQYASSIEYKGKKYPDSGVGAKDMTIEKDCMIIISVIIW